MIRPALLPPILAALSSVIFAACATSSNSAGGDGDGGPTGQNDAGEVDLECMPACSSGETCQDGECLSEGCVDGEDNDGDGWTDAADPDCADGDERGFGMTSCNDGEDNDGDSQADHEDPDCVSGNSHEVLGDGVCADECLLGATADGRECQLWDDTSGSWESSLQTGQGHMHHRARVYTRWLRERLLPIGGVMRGHFTDDSYNQVAVYAGTRDSPIWTGIYMASEAMRFAVTGSSDARAQLEKTLQVLHRWWQISGDRGYLARFAAPVTSPAPVLDFLEAGDPENHRNVPFQGETWHWKGNTSRDQYQGVFFGYAMVYDLVADESLREIIREDIVSTVEQLMETQTRTVHMTVDGFPVDVQMELKHVIYTDDETDDGKPRINVTTDPLDLVDEGLLVFWPNPAAHLRQVNALSWLPDVYLRTQAVQLGGMFAVALHVTKDVPAYADRHAAIQAHYDEHFSDWLEMAQGWENNNDCGSSYHGINIAFLPAFNWVRLEEDPSRKQALQDSVLRDRMWAAVDDHKNVFFSYIYGSQASTAQTGVIASHTAQLRQFPEPPNVSIAVDNRGQYPENPDCEGESSIAIDVRDRIPTSFLWERNPWKLVGNLEPNKLYPGVDYLITYWMARYFDYLDDDAPQTCLQWRD